MNIKNNIKKNFTIVPNELILDNSLSDRSRFIFVYMASKPDDWNFYMGNMCKELNLSEETTRKYISELKVAGWITSLGQTLKDGKYSATGYELNQNPKFPCTEKPDTENLRHGKNLAHNNKDFKQTSTIEKDEDDVIPPTPPIISDSFEVSKNTIRAHYENFMLTESTQKNNLCMTKRKTKKEMEILCIGYVISLLESGETMDSYKPDFQKHFSNWLNAYGLDNLMKIDKDQVNAQFKKLNLYQDADQAVN